MNIVDHDAISGEKPRAGPPSWATARKARSGSRAAKAQSVKLGGAAILSSSGLTPPRPSGPWQAMQTVS